MPSTHVDRAIQLLFPESGSRACDVKFFFTPGATAEAMAEQVVVCFAAMDDASNIITDVDQGLTA